MNKRGWFSLAITTRSYRVNRDVIMIAKVGGSIIKKYLLDRINPPPRISYFFHF